MAAFTAALAVIYAVTLRNTLAIQFGPLGWEQKNTCIVHNIPTLLLQFGMAYGKKVLIVLSDQAGVPGWSFFSTFKHKPSVKALSTIILWVTCIYLQDISGTKVKWLAVLLSLRNQSEQLIFFSQYTFSFSVPKILYIKEGISIVLNLHTQLKKTNKQKLQKPTCNNKNNNTYRGTYIFSSQSLKSN